MPNDQAEKLSARLRAKAQAMIEDRENRPPNAAYIIYGLAWASAMIGKGVPPLEAGAIIEETAEILYNELEQEALRAYE